MFSPGLRCLASLLSLMVLYGCETTRVPPPGRAGSCGQTVNTELHRLGIGDEQINKVSLIVRKDTVVENSVVVGVHAWVDLKSCEGYLIVDMFPECRVRQVYTRGECQIPGVKSFR